MQIRTATPDDVDLIATWRAEAAAWIGDLGFDQWSDAGIDDVEFRRRVSESICAGETWMAVDNETPVGTIAVDEHSDPGLWTSEELEHAVIAHRMIVPRWASGRGIGHVLVSQAERVAEQRGRMFIRLDAWTTNPALHQYYRRLGFRHVRTVPDAPTPSAALFERRVYSVPMPPLAPMTGCDP